MISFLDFSSNHLTDGYFETEFLSFFEEKKKEKTAKQVTGLREIIPNFCAINLKKTWGIRLQFIAVQN